MDNLEREPAIYRQGKAYRVQGWLAALDFLTLAGISTAHNPDICRKHFTRTIGLIRDRLSTRLVLNKQLGKLARGLVPMKDKLPLRVMV